MQYLDLQEDSLNKFSCENIFTDHIIGEKSNRSGLEMSIEFAMEISFFGHLDQLGKKYERLSIE